jgi:hypothetical protein
MAHTKDEALKLAQSAFKDIASETYDTGTNGEKAQRIAEAALPIIEQALEAQQEAPVALESGKRLIVVDQSFDELMYWLDRCEHKGHLENCADLVEPYSAFQYENYTAPPAAQPEPVTHPYGWHTEDHLTDKSATTYSKEVADRWKAKGWPVTPMYVDLPIEQVKK